MLCCIAAEAVDAVFLNPLGEPCGEIIVNSAAAAVLAELLAERALLLPLGLQEGRNGNAFGGLGAEVGKSGEHTGHLAAALFISGQTRADPLGTPPFCPVAGA